MGKRLPRWRESDYRAAWKRLRSVVSFTVDVGNLSPSEKRQIRIYDREKKSLEARGTKVVRPRTTKNVKAAQAYAQHGKGFPQFKVAFVPVATKKARVKIKGGKVTVTEDHVRRTVHQFSRYEKKKGERFTDLAAVIKRILARDKHSSQFVRICGQHEEKGTLPRNLALIVKACTKYQNGYTNSAQWFDGLIGYTFTAQSDFNDYRKARKLAKSKTKRKKLNPIRANER